MVMPYGKMINNTNTNNNCHLHSYKQTSCTNVLYVSVNSERNTTYIFNRMYTVHNALIMAMLLINQSRCCTQVSSVGDPINKSFLCWPVLCHSD